jgi:hypothetical protein
MLPWISATVGDQYSPTGREIRGSVNHSEARCDVRLKSTQAVMGWTPPRRPWCARVVVLSYH